MNYSKQIAELEPVAVHFETIAADYEDAATKCDPWIAKTFTHPAQLHRQLANTLRAVQDDLRAAGVRSTKLPLRLHVVDGGAS